MGNQLAAAPSVNVADVSSTLELVAPLAGARRSCFATLHCLQRVPLARVDAATAARCACADAYAQRRQRHRTRLRDERAHSSDNSSSSRGVVVAAAAQHGGGVAAHGGDTFAVAGVLHDKHSSYVQLLLMPSRTRLPYTMTATTLQQQQQLMRSTPRRTTPPPPPPSAPVYSSRSHTSTGRNGNSDDDAVAARVSVVVKVFVRNVGNDGGGRQAAYMQRVHALMRSVGEQLAAVDATRRRGVEVRGAVLYYSVLDVRRDARVAVLQRPYVTASLPQRLAAAPRWTPRERRFACYQLLQAVAQLHDVYGVVHGDIKANNVCVQSSGLLCLVDVAPYKPAWLPANNPELYHSYYDTHDSSHDDARSRDCCVAPEKFVDATGTSVTSASVTAAAQQQQPSTPQASSSSTTTMTAGGGDGTVAYDTSSLNVFAHTPAMDMFSVGCVMAHVLTGEALFCLADVLALRAMTTTATREAYVRSRLQPRDQRRRGARLLTAAMPLLLALVCALPAQRPSARATLALGRATGFFPRCFDTLYTAVLPPLLCRTPDVQAHMLYTQLDTIVAQCCGSSAADDDTHDKTTHNDSRSSNDCTPSFVVRVLSPLLQHAMRFAASDEAAYRAAVCMRRALRYGDACTLTRVMLPYALFVVNKVADTDAHTRMVALRVVCAIATRAARALRDVTATQQQQQCARTCDEDDGDDDACMTPSGVLRVCATLFDDLLLPCLGELLRCSSVVEACVLAELARRLPRMLLLARFCLVRRQLLAPSCCCCCCAGSGAAHTTRAAKTTTRHVAAATTVSVCAYVRDENDATAACLRASGWDMLQLLYRHHDASVVAALLRQTAHVAAFLGEERTQYDLLPLLTTLVATAAGDTTHVQRVLCARAVALHAVLQQQQQQQQHQQPPQLHHTLPSPSRQLRHLHQTPSLLPPPPALRMLRFFVDEGVRPQRTRACVVRTLRALAHVLRTTPLAASTTATTTSAAAYVDEQEGSRDDGQSTLTTLWQKKKMAIVHQVLPCLLSPHATVRRAACDVVAAATHAFARRDVLTHLACAVRPLLTHTLPLARLPDAAATVLRTDLQTRGDGDDNNDNDNDMQHNNTTHVRRTAATVTSLQRCARRLAQLPMIDVAANASTSTTTMTRSLLQQLATLPAHDASNRTAAHAHVLLRDPTRDAALPCHRHNNDNDDDNNNNDATAARAVGYTLTAREAARRAAAAAAAVHTAATRNNNNNSDDAVTRAAHTSSPSSSSSSCAVHTAAAAAAPLEPIAVPHSTRREHRAAIYDVCVLHSTDSTHYSSSPSSYRGSALLLSCGAREEALLWRVDASRGLQLLQRAPHTSSHAHDTSSSGCSCARASAYTCALPLCGRACAGVDAAATHVVLGSTSGVVSLLDVQRNTFVATYAPPPPRLHAQRDNVHTHDERASDTVATAAAVTAMRWVQRDVLLVARADGVLDACDVRVTRQASDSSDSTASSSSVWQTTLRARDGAPSCLVPLYDDSINDADDGGDVWATRMTSSRTASAYAVAVCTYDGVVCLYDLRFRRCVQRYDVCAFSNASDAVSSLTSASSSSSSLSSSRALYSACVDPTRPPSSCAVDGVSLLLGSGSGAVLRLQLRSGVVSSLLQPASSSSSSLHTRRDHSGHAMRAMLMQHTPDACVYTGGDDGHIRRWSLASLQRKQWQAQQQQQKQQEQQKQQQQQEQTPPQPPQQRRSSDASYGHALCTPPLCSPAYVCSDAHDTAYDARRRHGQDDDDDDDDVRVALSRPHYCIRETVAPHGSVPPQHHDAVTALAAVPLTATTTTTAQWSLVSAARDGTLTLWRNATR